MGRIFVCLADTCFFLRCFSDPVFPTLLIYYFPPGSPSLDTLDFL
jgi:hypothetical protein